MAEEVIWMSETDNNAEKNIIVSINEKEITRIPLIEAIKREWTIRYIVMASVEKNPEIQAVSQFFVYVNGKNVLPKEARHIPIVDVEIIEIFDRVPIDYKEK